MRRRELLVAAAAAVLARPAIAAADDGDGDIVKRLIAREEGAAYAYRGLRFPPAPDLAAHDTDHAKALRTQFQALGRGTQPISAETLDSAARRLAEEATVEAAIALEDDLLAVYRTAVIELTEPGILQTVATILASHAQHRALLARYSQ